jgi:hypothetical protein
MWPKPSQPGPYDANLAVSFKRTPYDASVAKPSLGPLPPRPQPQSGPRRRNATMAAWQFGNKVRRQRGNVAKNLTTPLRPFL